MVLILSDGVVLGEDEAAVDDKGGGDEDVGMTTETPLDLRITSGPPP